MRIFGKVLQTLRLSRRQSNFKPRRTSSFLCYHSFVRRSTLNNSRIIKNVTTRTVSSKSDSSGKGCNISKAHMANILPVALIQSKSPTTTTNIMLIPLNLLDVDEESNKKAMKTLSVIREHARQIEAFTENLMDTSDPALYNVQLPPTNATTLPDQYSAQEDVTLWSQNEEASGSHAHQPAEESRNCGNVSLYENLERAVAEQEMNRIEAHDCYDVAAWNSTKRDLAVIVPESLEEKLQQMAISSMQLAFEMDMSNIRDAIMRSAAIRNINLFKPPTPKSLQDPTLTMKANLDLKKNDAKNTIPLDFNAIIQGTVEIDPSKYTPTNLGEIKVPEFSDCVTAIAANICSTALQKGFPADLSRMAYSTNTPCTEKKSTERNPHIVCVREGSKGCVSPGNAVYPNFIPKDSSGAATVSNDAAGSGKDKTDGTCISSEISLLSSSEIIGYNSRGLMSCKAYALALIEATKRRAVITKTKTEPKTESKDTKEAKRKKDKCGDPKNNPCTKPIIDECGNEVKKNCPDRKKEKKKDKCPNDDPCKKADGNSNEKETLQMDSKTPCGGKNKNKNQGKDDEKTTGCGKPKNKGNRCNSDSDACKKPKECPKPKKQKCDLGDPCNPCEKSKKKSEPKPKKTCSSSPVLYSEECPLPTKQTNNFAKECKGKEVQEMLSMKKSKSTSDVTKCGNKSEQKRGKSSDPSKNSESSNSKKKCVPFVGGKKSNNSKCEPPKKSAADSKCAATKKSACDSKSEAPVKSASGSKCGAPKKSASDSKCGKSKESESESKCGAPKKSASDSKCGAKSDKSNKEECKRYEGFCSTKKKSACSSDKKTSCSDAKKSEDKSVNKCKNINSPCDLKKSKSSYSGDKESSGDSGKKCKPTKSLCDLKKSSSSGDKSKSSCTKDEKSSSISDQKCKKSKNLCGEKKSTSKAASECKSEKKSKAGSENTPNECKYEKKSKSDSECKSEERSNSDCKAKKKTAPNCKKSASGSKSGSDSACKKYSTFTHSTPISEIFAGKRYFSTSATYKIPQGPISWRHFSSKKGSKGKKSGQESSMCMKHKTPRRTKRVDVLKRKKPKDCYTESEDMCQERTCKDPKESSCADRDKKENKSPMSLSLRKCLRIAGPLTSLKKRYYGSDICKQTNAECYDDTTTDNECENKDKYDRDECDVKDENDTNLINDTRNEVVRIMEPCTVERCLEAIPNFSEYDVLVRTAAVAISGSDLHYYETGGKCYPGMTLGHDATGVIEEVGCSIKKLRPGDRVVVESGLACGICDYCKRGCYNICNQLIFNGFLRKYQVHPADLCHKIPGDVCLLEATLTQTLTLGCQACFKAQVLPTTNLLVIGASPTAISTALCARAIGVHNICIVSTMKDPLDMIETTFDFNCMHYEQDMQYGMILECLYSHLHDWPDAVINCAISEKTMNLAVMALKPCGICVLAECDTECACFNAMDVLMKNLKFIPSFRSINMFPTALSLIQGGMAPIGLLVAKIFEWQEVEKAFRRALCESNVGYRKVIVRCMEEEGET
ncbi:uncharacterized protein [Eurosta solidaginis]|uniref:uncharacterized protein n=1 Tax=Eurosta solidaginis TaxID=178769 RepID=UPI0035311F50